MSDLASQPAESDSDQGGAAVTVFYSAQIAAGFALTWVSAEAPALLGYAADALVEDAGFWLRHVHPEDLARVRAATAGGTAPGAAVCTYRVRHANGAYVVLRDERRWRPNPGGGAPELVGTWQPVAAPPLPTAAGLDRSAVLELVLQCASEGIIVADATGRFVYWNPAAQAIVGLGPVDAPPEAWPEQYGIYEPDGTTPAPTAALPLVRALRGESVDGTALVLRHAARPGGVPVRVSGRPIRAADGTVLGGVTVISDVTAEGDARAALDAHNRELAAVAQAATDDAQAVTAWAAAVLEAVPVAILTVGADGRIYDANPAAAALSCATRGALAGRPLEAVYGLAPMALSTLAERAATGPPLVVTIHPGAGAPRTVQLRAVPARQGDAARYVVALHDVTAEREAQRAMEDSEHKLRALIEHAPDGILVLDVDAGRYVLANEPAAALTGRSREALLQCGPADISAARQAGDQPVDEAIRATVAAALAGERPDFDWLLRHADGDTIPVRVRLLPIPDPARRLVRTSLTDLREQQALEAQFRQAQKMEAIGQLAGGVAHDINNQLSGVIGFSELAMRGLPEDHPARADLALVQEAGEKAAGIARQLLAFSRRQMLDPQVVDPHDVIAGLERMLPRVLGERVEIALVRASGGARARLDPGQLEQVVLNLAINARDAMPDGGRITIETGRRDLAGADARRLGVPAGAYARITVADTGTGMDAHTHEHLFEPFFTTKPAGQGTGLGLAMVHGFVYQSGGFIEVESAPSEGTRFHLHFPAVAAPRDPVRRRASGTLPPGRERLYVLEDDPSVRMLVTRVLQECGYTVHAFATGAELLAALDPAAPPALLLADVVLPGLSGPETAERVRAAVPDVRVCFMSGYPRDDGHRRGVVAFGDAFLPKPVTPGTVARAVRAALDEPRTA